jgi:hypothetical protein
MTYIEQIYQGFLFVFDKIQNRIMWQIINECYKITKTRMRGVWIWPHIYEWTIFNNFVALMRPSFGILIFQVYCLSSTCFTPKKSSFWKWFNPMDIDILF